MSVWPLIAQEKNSPKSIMNSSKKKKLKKDLKGHILQDKIPKGFRGQKQSRGKKLTASATTIQYLPALTAFW